MSTAATGVRVAAKAPQLVLISMVRGYRRWISPMTEPRCKYHPTCSAYALEALEEHGAMAGTALASWRLLRCNPWSHGGVDDVPLRGQRLFRLHRNNDAMTMTPMPAPDITVVSQ